MLYMTLLEMMVLNILTVGLVERIALAWWALMSRERGNLQLLSHGSLAPLRSKELNDPQIPQVAGQYGSYGD